jgi:hypothetical protein
LLERRLARSGHEHVAIAIDPLAAAAAAYADGTPVARLREELLAATDPAAAAVISRAVRIRELQTANRVRVHDGRAADPATGSPRAGYQPHPRLDVDMLEGRFDDAHKFGSDSVGNHRVPESAGLDL